MPFLYSIAVFGSSCSIARRLCEVDPLSEHWPGWKGIPLTLRFVSFFSLLARVEAHLLWYLGPFRFVPLARWLLAAPPCLWLPLFLCSIVFVKAAAEMDSLPAPQFPSLNSNKVALSFLLRPFLKSFIGETKNPKRDSISLGIYGAQQGSPPPKFLVTIILKVCPHYLVNKMLLLEFRHSFLGVSGFLALWPNEFLPWHDSLPPAVPPQHWSFVGILQMPLCSSCVPCSFLSYSSTALAFSHHSRNAFSPGRHSASHLLLFPALYVPVIAPGDMDLCVCVF